jgi:hypothetical protein
LTLLGAESVYWNGVSFEHMKRLLNTFLVLLTLFFSASATGFVSHWAANSTDPELQACFEQLASIEELEQKISFTTSSGVQSTGSSGVTVLWKKFGENNSRILVRVTAPPARLGIGLLILEEDQATPGLHMYLPELRSVRRISGNTLNGSLLGSDFNYEDFLYFYGLSKTSKIERKENAVVARRAVFVSDLIPQDENSSYTKIRTFIDQQWCVPLLVEFYARDSDQGHAQNIEKTLTIDTEHVNEVDGYHIPQRFEMHDHRDDTRTAVVVESIEVNRPIREGKFSLSELRSGR